MGIDPELIAKYYAGKCSSEEKQLVDQWLTAGEPKEDYDLDQGLDPIVLKNEIWSSLSSREVSTRSEEPETDIQNNPRLPAKRKWFISGIAASLVFALLVGYRLWKPANSSKGTGQSQYAEVSVPYGKKAVFTLPDGTVVHLNSGSKLKYPKGFNNSERRLNLQGEGFFNVANDPARPFIVETPRSFTQVLGTRFNLRDFEKEKANSIVVEDGKVRFSGKGSLDTLVLSAGRLVILDSLLLQQEIVDATLYSDWKDQVLRFQGIPLSEAVPMIERWYNVHIRLDQPEMGNMTIKGSFRQATLNKVLDDLSFLLNVHYRTDKQGIRLYKNK